jgi:hypothetical protein
MADWTNLPNTAVGVGGLPSGTTVTALRDNPIAIVQGALGAPFPVTIAENADLYPLSVAPGNLTLSGVLYTGSFSSIISTSSGTFVTAGTVTITARATGIMRFAAAITGQTGTTAVGRLVKNGVEVDALTVTASTQTLTLDVAALAGDVFEWQIRRSGGSELAVIQPVAIRANKNVTTRPIAFQIME